jgi:hypothetical protein
MSSSVRFGPAFVPTKESGRAVDNEHTEFSNRSSAERYYTEHLQISTDEGADNELVRADINETLQRGWRLVRLTPGPGVDTVELVWDTSGGSEE